MSTDDDIVPTTLNFEYFDPAIVLEFQPEAPPLSHRTPLTLTPVYDFMYCVDQTVDYARALHYIENKIYPELSASKEKKFRDLTPTKVVDWIMALHSIVARSQAIEEGFEAGQFSLATTIRWIKTIDMKREIERAILNFQSTKSIFARYGLEALHDPFFELLARIDTDPSVELMEEKRQMHGDLYQKALRSDNAVLLRLLAFYRQIYRLVDAFHQGKLTSQERNLVNQFLSINMVPEDIPAKMEAFANQLIYQLRVSDGSNESAISLANQARDTLDLFHAFYNGNRRLANLVNYLIRLLFGITEPIIAITHTAHRRQRMLYVLIMYKKLRELRSLGKDEDDLQLAFEEMQNLRRH